MVTAQQARLTNHVESIGGKSQRVGKEAGDELDQEENGINGNHDLDASALGERHLGAHCSKQALAMDATRGGAAPREAKLCGIRVCGELQQTEGFEHGNTRYRDDEGNEEGRKRG